MKCLSSWWKLPNYFHLLYKTCLSSQVWAQMRELGDTWMTQIQAKCWAVFFKSMTLLRSYEVFFILYLCDLWDKVRTSCRENELNVMERSLRALKNLFHWELLSADNLKLFVEGKGSLKVLKKLSVHSQQSLANQTTSSMPGHKRTILFRWCGVKASWATQWSWGGGSEPHFLWHFRKHKAGDWTLV